MEKQEMGEKLGIESSLFDWEGWDQIDTMCFTFHRIILKCDIGEFKKGTKFVYAILDLAHCELELGADPISSKFQLELKIGG